MLLLQKYGHYKFKCSKLRNKEEVDQASSSSVAGVVEESYEDVEFALAVSISDNRFCNKWVLDITSTFHMSLKMDWFTTYK